MTYKGNVKIFSDGANISEMILASSNKLISGFTTNPSLMRKAGVIDYKKFCLDAISAIPDKPLSFEIFSDDLHTMEEQALEISGWGDNIYIKIPITNTKREYTYSVIEKLIKKGVKVNITAITTFQQVKGLFNILDSSLPSYISIFAGRIADTGVDPINIIQESLNLFESVKSVEFIWASPRELLNIFQAEKIGCHIITVSSDILNKIKLIGYNLDDYSLDTVKMFYEDALKSGYKLS